LILVFGTICLDRVRTIARLPGAGGYAEVLEEHLMLGGEAANTAFALAAWGAEIQLAGNPLGDGPEGEALLEMVRQKGLPTDRLTASSGSAPVCDVYVTPNGERTMFGMGFRELGSLATFDSLSYQSGEWFTADPNMGDTARAAARRAIESGMRLYLMDFLRDDDPIAEGSYWQSSTDWTGYRGNTQKNVALVAEQVARHRAFCILSDGPNGLVAGSPEMPARAYPPYPCPKLVDSTGAGDMLRSGVLLGLERGWDIADCLRFGSAAGSLKCQALGATTYVPSFEEVRAHIDAHPEVSRQYA